MRVKENKAFPLKIPRFVVDKVINEELEAYEVFKHINRSSANAILGCSGTGKTSFLYSLLTNTNPKIYKKQFESIICVMPRASRASLKNNIFDKYLDKDTLFDALTEDTIVSIRSTVEANAEEGLQTLLILDDVASSLKNPFIAKELQHLVYAYRHFRLNILMLVQTIKTIPLPIRKNLTNLIVFYKPKICEWHTITEEFLEIHKDEAEGLYKMLFKEKYDWTLINLTTGKIYNKFNEVVYKEDD